MTPSNTLILSSIENGIGFITLNRPEALNAVNYDMALSLLNVLEAWKEDPSVSVVVLQSALPKAFCAGGDIKMVYHALKENRASDAKAFHALEYKVNATLRHYPKPTITLGSGLVMGGGMGLVMHCRYRLATNTSSWAMPEAAIGLFPDVGLIYFFNKCPHYTGYLMALSGYRACPSDLVYTDLATHYLESETFPIFIQGLKQAPTEENATAVIDILLENLAMQPPEESPLEAFSDKISDCFSHKTVPEIIAATEDWFRNASHPAEKKWVHTILQLIDLNSPLSLCVTLAYLRKSKQYSLEEIHRMDQRLGEHFFKHGDFTEGVRAKLIDKCQTPNWLHAALEYVPEAEINSFFEEPT